MRFATAAGIVLIGLGVLSLAYFMFPLGFLMQAGLNQQKMNLVPPALGAIAFLSGITLLAVVRPRENKDKSEP